VRVGSSYLKNEHGGYEDQYEAFENVIVNNLSELLHMVEHLPFIIKTETLDGGPHFKLIVEKKIPNLKVKLN
jgi:hypothetical protein